MQGLRHEKDLIVRPMAAGDLNAAMKLTQALKWPHRFEDWELHFRLGRGWVVCDADGILLGTILWWPCGEIFGTLGLVVVAPNQRGKGIGRRLMDLVIADAGPGALQLIATPAGLKLYQQCGFRETGTISQHQGMPVTVDTVPPPAGTVVRPVAQSDFAALFGLDAAAFGADRHRVLEALLTAGSGVVAERAGKPCGYALTRAFGRGAIIGPVVAPGEMLAISLVSQLLNSSQGFTRMDIPSDAARLTNYLAAVGLVRVDQGMVMIRGDRPVGPSESALRVFGLASQALN